MSVRNSVGVAGLDLRWIRGKTGDWSRTIAEVELIAAELMVAEQPAMGLDWCHNYVKRSGAEPHQGDCSVCRSWLTAPITCDACVYDEYMLKAWAKKHEAVTAAATMREAS